MQGERYDRQHLDEQVSDESARDINQSYHSFLLTEYYGLFYVLPKSCSDQSLGIIVAMVFKDIPDWC